MPLLRQLRLQHGLTQAELARQIHRSKSFISHIENGDALPGREALQELTRIFNVPMDALLESMQQSDPPPSPQTMVDQP